MVYPKLNVQNSAELWDKITAPEWSCPPITPFECAGYDEYLTPNDGCIEWEFFATVGMLGSIMIVVMIVCQVSIYLTQWQERRWARRLVKAGPEERVDVLRSWCEGLGVNVEGTDLDLGEERPLPYTIGISHTELREDVEEQNFLGDEEGEKMEKAALI
jgi:hypothetical protein